MGILRRSMDRNPSTSETFTALLAVLRLGCDIWSGPKLQLEHLKSYQLLAAKLKNNWTHLQGAKRELVTVDD